MTTLPKDVRTVIIGGGILGCSIAYHLGKAGWSDTLLLERKSLTSGTTWHAAGLVRAALSSENLTRLAKYTIDLYTALEKETGQATGFVQPGSISVATNPERWEELRRGADMLHAFDVEAHAISPAEAQVKWPLLNVEDVIGAIWYPRDGKCNPADVTMALAKGARLSGARIVEGTHVEEILVENGRAVGVRTDRGTVRADHVVCAAGMWSREIGARIGVNIPLQACEHFYVVTEPMDGVGPDLPVMRDMEAGAYFKEDAGKLLIGAFEPVAKPWAVDGIPADFAFGELPEDFDHFAPILEGAMHRVPALQAVGIRKFFNGPESFTADQRYILGPAPEVKNVFVAAGFNSIGIQSAGGAGMALAHWIMHGEPPFDLWDVDIRRLMPHMGRKHFLVPRVSEALGLLYAMHWPYRQFESSRGVRQSPFHEQWRGLGACFGEVAGWERPNWYAPAGVEPRYRYSWGRQNWFDYCGEDVRATRRTVAVYDLSTFAKYSVAGPDAERLLQRLSTADISGPGRAHYTQWLNEKGGIEADLTITRLSDTGFLVVTAAATAVRDWHYLRDRIEPGMRVELADVTSAYGVLGVMGPNSRALLQRLTDADLSDAAFPFGASREIEIGAGRVRATRISYVGELGWELYIPADFARHVLAGLLEAGAAFELRPAGMHAMDSCRLEKGFRHWGHDVGPADTILEAGLGFTCAFGKSEPFTGRDAVLRQKETGILQRRLVQFKLRDPQVLVYHNEPIYRDGVIVGLISSGGYGHWLGASVGMGYVEHPDGVDDHFLRGGRFEIGVALARHEAEASLRPFHDPGGHRMREAA